MRQESAKPRPAKISARTYVIGYILALCLTLVAFYAVKAHVDSGHTFLSDNFMLAIISVLAIVQLMVQLVFFLHLDKESRPRWNFMAFLLALMFIFILVAGSIWIMYHLDYSMTPHQQDQYLIKQDGGI
ncbi:MAG TPA: cytochrome o ubiquinol oxidase subunit IV [Candidatus Saccharimonadales bacterium]|nr:cytochrome o ubiquinol oxidase subunit IV [Candidatus Saccharimonadales bacterium]